MVMSKHSRNSRAPASAKRPFAAEIAAAAKRAIAQYQVSIWFDEDENRYYACGIELPLVMGDGKTPEECLKNTRQALFVIVATMIESGESPPLPAKEGKRDQQVNIRLTRLERLQLEAAARKTGAPLSDFVRAAALAGVHRQARH
jgi:predicted RNase H-like HicB family nuclease